MVKITEEARAARAQNHQRLNDWYRSSGQNDYGPSIDWTRARLESLDATRSDVACYRQSRAMGMGPHIVVDQVTKAVKMTGRGHDLVAGVTILALKEDAQGLLRAGDFKGAIAKYLEALKSIVGTDAVLPASTVYDKVWLHLSDDDAGVRHVNPISAEQNVGDMKFEKYVDAIALASNIAHCYMKLNMHVEAIDWLQEVEVIMECNRAASMREPQPTWKLVHLTYVEHWSIRFKLWMRNCALFTELENSAVASCCAAQAMFERGQVPDAALREFPQFAALRNEFDPWDYFKHRHPEPNLTDHEVSEPELQVLGVWERLPYAAGTEKPLGRMWPSTWIWRGSLYIAGGVVDKGSKDVELNDMWRLDLAMKTWRRLPDLAGISFLCGKTSGPMRVWNDMAYHFTGKQKLAVFDLAKERWDFVTTSMADGMPWPYYNVNDVSNFATTVMDGVLYAFGGQDGNVILGNNIFMALDLRTMTWTHLGGTSAHVPQNFEPNLRTNAALWAVPEQKKLFLLYGNAERANAYLKRAPHGSEMDWAYADFWSFALNTRAWTRERLRGNFASPRSEMADVHSPALGRTVVYGGYHGSLMTLDNDQSRSLLGSGQLFRHSYFGDTLLFDPATHRWQLVLVKGFPSYRAASTLVCDPDDGKTYLFGGYTNSEFCPSKSVKTRTYSDLWQLKIDMPGGHWDPKDLERDIRMERAGPWMRCFTCGVCGISWQKCGGTCGGKYYFCSKDCQKNGWKEHKETHGCRKKT